MAGRLHRRLGGWGFTGENFPPTPELLAWLTRQIGPAVSCVPAGAEGSQLPRPRPVPHLGCGVSADEPDRLAHARGQGLPDILRLRAGAVPAFPDAVCWPKTADEVAGVLARCDSAGVEVIPWGGGTSVTGGVNVLPEDRPVVVMDLSALAALESFDERSRLATFGAGILGPALEASLASRGYTLGHFPQSWELSSLGGWVATRSAGQESLGFGRIDDMVAGLEAAAPGGRLSVRPMPGSAAGPDLKRLLLGSEGRFGIITSVTVRVRPLPSNRTIQSLLFPSWHDGMDAVRTLVQSGVPLTMLRLSDPPETEVAMAVGLGATRAAGLVRRYLHIRGIGDGACLLLVGAAGDPQTVRRTLRQAGHLIDGSHGVSLGTRPGAQWLKDRFRHPYLRDALLDVGVATDTLETAAPWSALDDVRQSVREAIAGALEGAQERVAVLCHISHPYPDGASLYFTFFFRVATDHGETIARWAAIKRAATNAIAAAGATLSHHHGIGQWHAPWLEQEAGSTGVAILRSVAHQLDPNTIINPHVLLDPMTRLEA